jgi:hypothetical protein
MEDKLLFILTYIKQNPRQAVQGQLFGMTQSNVSKWYQLLLTVLHQALQMQSLLPARTMPDLARYLIDEIDQVAVADPPPAMQTEVADPLFVVKTDSSAPSPPSLPPDAPLFIMMAPNDLSNAPVIPMTNASTTVGRPMTTP